MKRIEARAAAALVLAGLILLGLVFFLVRLTTRGEDWATYSANEHIYRGGMLKNGQITDRNGVVLASVTPEGRSYAEDETLRIASLHAVGDYRGYIGAGALRLFDGRLSGYTFWNGTPEEGSTVTLTLDAALQKTAWKALDGRRGAVTVMNYETGELLCMVSSPSYDPYDTPDTSIDGLFVNRATSGAFTPGSIYKLVTLIAAEETIPDLAERTFVCRGETEIGGRDVVCSGHHGEQTVEQALANSCNVAFGELAHELGGELLAEYAERLGVSGSLSFHGTATASGRFDIAGRGSFEEAWSGIGQYNDLVTPYAMMRLCAGIAAGGTVTEPTLLPGESPGKTVLMSREIAETVGEYMNYTVVWRYGEDRFPGLDLCAKTGTAERSDGASNAWFVGYLRSGAPLAFAVVLEKGGGGLAEAAPAANRVLQKAMEIYGA